MHNKQKTQTHTDRRRNAEESNKRNKRTLPTATGCEFGNAKRLSNLQSEQQLNCERADGGFLVLRNSFRN